MLMLVLGRSGYGKTEYALKLIKDHGFDKLTLVVPEQFSLSAESRLLSVFETDALPSDTVTSFSRLASRVTQQYMPRQDYINGLGRRVLMKRAIKNQSGALKMYKDDTSRSLIDAFLSVRSEMKAACVSADALYNESEALTGSTVADKLSDISLVIGEFDSLLSSRFADREDDLTKLASLITEKGLFKNETVVFDGFNNFSAQEKNVIAAVMTQAAAVVITLPCASVAPDENETDSGIFKNVRSDAAFFLGMANRLNIRYETVLLKENMRAQTDELKTVEGSFFGSAASFDSCKGIELYNAFSPADEAELVAQLIRRDVMTGGCRYSDCAVVARNLNKYRVTLCDAFLRMRVPFYMDQREDITLRPLFTLVEAALKAAENRRRDENVFRALKTGYFPAEIDEIFELENYVLMWGIGGDSLFNEYSLNPDGFEEMTEEAKDKLERLNSTRSRVMPPMERLCKALSGTFGARSACLAIYAFLCELNAAGQTDAACEMHGKNGDAVKAAEEVRVYSLLLSVLDQIVLAAGDEELTAQEFCELFTVACQDADMGRIPPVYDCVTVGSADRVRLDSVRRVYVIGANEGEFPGAFESGGILTSRERELLCSRGIDIGGAPMYWSVEEMFIAYKTLTSPSHGLTVIYAQSENGVLLSPSQIVSRLKKLFPTLRDERYGELDMLTLATTDESALSLLSRGENDAAAAAAREHLKKTPAYAPVIAKLDNVYSASRACIGDRDTASALFRRDMRVSATRLDTFSSCRYMYFLRYGLNLKPREKLQMSFNNAGTIVHFLLENVIRELCEGDAAQATQQQLKDLTDKYAKIYFEKYAGGETGKTGSFTYVFGRLQELTLAVLDNFVSEMKQSLYRPSDFELEIGSENGIPPYTVECEDGSVSVYGKIDRVDVMTDEGSKFVRIIDYKTGSKEFRLHQLLYGLNTQMLIYLFAIEKNGDKYKEYLPGGVLYLNAVRKKETATDGKKPDDTGKAKSGIEEMKGLLINDIDSLKGMEEELNGRYIPVTLKKSGITSASLVSDSDLKVLNEYIDIKLKEMHDSLISGEINARPVKTSRDKTACDHCKYRGICSFDGSTDEYREEDESIGNPAAMDIIRDAVGVSHQADGGETNG